MTDLYNLATLNEVDMTTIYTMNNDENKNKNKNKLSEHNIVFNTCSTEYGKYRILKYDKQFLTPDTVSTTGLYRSVVLRDSNILSYSPPKSLKDSDFMSKYPNPSVNRGTDIVAEEYIEGTMINVFFDPNIGDDGDWEVSTRSNIGARTAFFRDGTLDHESTFRYMFLEAANKADLFFDTLCKDYCYSFVLQHPKNRIVLPIREPLIYLVACYNINNETKTVSEVSRGTLIDMMEKTMVCFAGRWSFSDYNELKEAYASGNTDYKVMGVVLKNLKTGERSKIRNPNYECVRKLKGNQPKLQYQYLTLRKDGNVSKYLHYFGEVADSFSQFRDQVHQFTQQLHTNYIMCYVKKTKPLIEYPEQFRTHMFNLHKIYLNELREKNDKITKRVVIDYINNLHPSKLMYSLNFSMRKRKVETNINDSISNL